MFYLSLRHVALSVLVTFVLTDLLRGNGIALPAWAQAMPTTEMLWQKAKLLRFLTLPNSASRNCHRSSPTVASAKGQPVEPGNRTNP
jgi:hypothetical protein